MTQPTDQDPQVPNLPAPAHGDWRIELRYLPILTAATRS